MKFEERDVKTAIQRAVEKSVWKKEGKNDKVRKFNESVEMIVNLKELDLKDPTNRFSLEFLLPYPITDTVKACIIADGDTLMHAKEMGYDTLDKEWLQNAKQLEKKVIKRLCKKYKYFIARADMMRFVAPALGRYLAPVNKMPIPQPNGFSIITPNQDLQEAIDKFKSVTRIIIKKAPVIQTKFGTKLMAPNELEENGLAMFRFLVQKLPRGQDNIRSIIIKTTMGQPVNISMLEA
ncbi:MAG TPA: hypothetical protein VKK79_21450 [Candidatus Lokiarchaeia archaeon]|nr:hypothetical protein [Candidatus Lokiarchaeia archaeon]